MPTPCPPYTTANRDLLLTALKLEGRGSIATIATIARSPVHPVKSIFWLAIRQLWRLMISVEESFAGLFLVWQQLSSLVPFDWLQDLEIFGGNRLIIHTLPQIHGTLWEIFFEYIKTCDQCFHCFLFQGVFSSGRTLPTGRQWHEGKTAFDILCCSC